MVKVRKVEPVVVPRDVAQEWAAAASSGEWS